MHTAFNYTGRPEDGLRFLVATATGLCEPRNPTWVVKAKLRFSARAANMLNC